MGLNHAKVDLITRRRQAGYTIREIGTELGISSQRVHQLYKHSKLFEPRHNSSHLEKDYDEIYAQREYSYYYTILLKQYGKEKADFIWDCRNFEESIGFEKALKYKPKNPLVAIGEGNYRYSTEIY